MKHSYYNFKVDMDNDTYVIYNSKTNALATLESDEIKKI